ncbi:hypothetical protein L914_21438, partial [Phytophthora nicotianae]
MGHGKALSEQKYWFIVGLHGGGVSLHEIARKTGRSRTSVRNAVKAERGPKEDSGGERRAGRQPALTEQELRQLVRAAATGEFFAAQDQARHQGFR